ncbi:MAG: hypothetical protein AAFQ36_14275 [Pseudomonadota bacterium]
MMNMMREMSRTASGRDDTDIIGRISQFLVDSGDPGPAIIVPPGKSIEDVTVLLPSDNAFRKFVRDTELGPAVKGMTKEQIGDYLTQNLSTSELYDIILYSIAFDGQTLAELRANGEQGTALGPSWTLVGGKVVDQDADAADATIIRGNIESSTFPGTISHVVSEVPRGLDYEQVPQVKERTLYDELTRKGPSFDHNGRDHDILTALVEIGGKDLLDDPTADLTLAAPTDSALARFARDLGFGGWSSEERILDYLLVALPLGFGVPRKEAVELFLTELTSSSATGPNRFSFGETEASNGVFVKTTEVDFEFSLSKGTSDAEMELFVGTNHRDYAITEDMVDVIYARSGNDYVISRGGDDHLMLGNGHDWAIAGEGDDMVVGGRGRDQIWSSSGDDVVIGGRGNDKISLGHGEDVFVYRPDDGFDRLYDFDADEDIIDLTAFRDGSGADVNVTVNSHGLIFIDGRASIQLLQFSDTDLTEDNFLF